MWEAGRALVLAAVVTGTAATVTSGLLAVFRRRPVVGRLVIALYLASLTGLAVYSGVK